MMPSVPAARAAADLGSLLHSPARSTYDRLSRWYDWLSRSERRLVLAGVHALAVQPGESVLEIGPGTGHALLALARSVAAEGWAAGLDLSPAMLTRSRHRLARAGLAQAVPLVCGDGARLPFSRAAFDAVFLSFTLELFPEAGVPAVLAECHRVLRPGGRVGVVSLSRQGGSRAMLRLYGCARTRFPAWVDCRPMDAALALREGGFRIVASWSHTVWGLPVQVVLAAKADS